MFRGLGVEVKKEPGCGGAARLLDVSVIAARIAATISSSD